MQLRHILRLTWKLFLKSILFFSFTTISIEQPSVFRFAFSGITPAGPPSRLANDFCSYSRTGVNYPVTLRSHPGKTMKPESRRRITRCSASCDKYESRVATCGGGWKRVQIRNCYAQKTCAFAKTSRRSSWFESNRLLLVIPRWMGMLMCELQTCRNINSGNADANLL